MNKLKIKIKHHEFWNPRVFETPFYVYLLYRCILKRIHPINLVKANYSLDHGDIGIGSKYELQKVFDNKYFLPTILLDEENSLDKNYILVKNFAKSNGFPILLKSDNGDAGRGIIKINSLIDLKRALNLLHGNFICQKFVDLSFEYGVFYTRKNGFPKITGINKKFFPEIIGDGKKKVYVLINENPRFNSECGIFLKGINLDKVLPEGEKLKLSFIGSHTLGCKFVDKTSLITPELEKKIFEIFENLPGFNFGRLDIKAESEEDFVNGKFQLIEINGVSSLPTQMFDPSYSIRKAYSIFFSHARDLVDIAKEHKNQSVEILPIKVIIQKLKKNKKTLGLAHKKLKSLKVSN